MLGGLGFKIVEQEKVPLGREYVVRKFFLFGL